MSRAAYLALIAAVFAAGAYFAFVDFRTLETGSALSATGVYEAIACLISAVALFMDYRQPRGDEDAIAQ